MKCLKRHELLITSLVLCGVITGCASNRRGYDRNTNMGEAKRHVMEAQIMHRNKALNPDPNPVDNTDGIYIGNVLGIYRDLISDPGQGVKGTPPKIDPRIVSEQ